MSKFSISISTTPFGRMWRLPFCWMDPTELPGLSVADRSPRTDPTTVLLLTVFRPNLEDRVALTVLDQGWLPRRRLLSLGANRAA